jgi:dTDP-4-dehydrorhamnose reductase
MSPSETPTVLITGAAGMLGHDLMTVFGRGCRVVPADLPEFDILKAQETIRTIEHLKPSLIVHAAAYTAVDKAEAERDLAMAVNGEGAGNVARGAARCGARMVYISSDYLFDGTKPAPYTEEDEPHPLSVYGLSKLAGERAVQEHLEHFLIVRTAWLFGPAKGNFVSGMAARATKSEAVSVVNDQTGCPTYTPHLAGAIRRLWEIGAEGIVNVTNGGACTWFDLTRETYRLAGADPDLVASITTAKLNRPAPRPAYSPLSPEKFRRLTGEGLPSWRTALAEYFSLRDSWRA